MNRRWAAVVFDLDGVLIDSEPVFLEAARRLLAERGRELDHAFMHQVMGMPGRDVLPRFQEHFQLDLPIPELGFEYKRHFFEILAGAGVPLRPGVHEILKHVQTVGHLIGLATSSQRVYVDKVFAPYGFLTTFRHVLTCDDVPNGKPSPDIYELAATRFGTTPDRLLVIEDSPNGVQAAKSAGCFCVAIPQAHVGKERVAAADVIVDSLVDPELMRLVSDVKVFNDWPKPVLKEDSEFNDGQ
jgi:HAD superfamily hydrolase (TIGR01509 family)